MAAAEPLPERDFRRSDCDDRCVVIFALVPGRFGRSDLLMHSPEAHEAAGYERGLAEGLSRPAGADRRSPDIAMTGPLVVDLRRFEAWDGDRRADLTPTEFKLLRALAVRLGGTVDRDLLIADVWGYPFLEAIRTSRHMLRVNMHRLRARLGRSGPLILSVPGLGYRLEALPPGAPVPPADELARLTRVRPLSMRWSAKYGLDGCRDCKRSQAAHTGRGLCSVCYSRRFREGTLDDAGRR